MYFGFPETKNRTIEEVALLFDGPDAALQRRNSHGEDPEIEIHEEPEPKEWVACYLIS